MSHEIRTPLGAIIGFSELLKDPALHPDERKRYVEIIHRTGENLTKIINDILDLSKVEAGRLEFERTSFALKTFLDDLHEIMSIKAAEKDVDLRFENSGEIPEWIITDPVRLRQVLINLVGNAIKFSHEGGSVRMTCNADPRTLRFTISDTGDGIPREAQGKLFQPFSQVSGQANPSTGGTGLGLFLSRRLARALGGDIQLIHSSMGRGSTFQASIRYEVGQKTFETEPLHLATSRSPSAPLSDAILTGKRILFVDDAMENRILVNRILTKRGARVEVASNGREGVEQALQNDFDLVLMDMQMPVMDGFEATRELRRLGYQKPIVALTAQAMKEDRRRCLEAGCQDYLTKPIQSAELVDRVFRLINRPTPVSGASIAEMKLGTRKSQPFESPDAP
jgi:CheY-like chemotaxis protein/two-component sensor histidine kinase